MSDTVIKVENLSKQYRIGARQQGYKTFREAIVDTVKAPLKIASSLLSAPSSLMSSTNDTIWALKDVTFEIKRGDVVGIIGRNGAGKSTLLKILSKITEPTEGRVELKGRVGSLLEVGTGFHPELTGHENVYLYGAILGMDRYEVTRKFDEIVAFAELEKFIDTPVKRYSSGMYMRLAFAVAANLEPEILLVDEVLAVGDFAFQKKCLGKMGNVSKEGRTVLFVSHNMAAVRKLCLNCILIDNGNIKLFGKTDNVISNYLATNRKEATATVELPLLPSDTHGRGIILRLYNKAGKPQSQFKMGESWRLVFEFEILHAIEHVIAAVGLVSLEAVPIITYWSEPKDLTKGLYSIELEFDLPLKSGNFQFAVGISSFERAIYYVDGIGNVSITGVSMGKQPLRESGGGILYSKQKYHIMAIGA